MTKISKYASNAQNSAESLINQGVDFVDDNLGEINAQTAILSNTLDKMIPVFENLEDGCDDLAGSLDRIVLALEEIKLYVPDLGDEIENINAALSDISKVERNIRRVASRLNRALNDLDNAVEFNDAAKVRAAVLKLSAAVGDIRGAKENIKKSLDAIITIIETNSESFENIGVNAEKIAENLKTIKNNADTTISALQTVKDSLDTIVSNAEIDFSEFKSAAQNMGMAIEYLGEATYYITHNINDLMTPIEEFTDKIKEYADDVSEQLNSANDNLKQAVTSLSYATEDIEAAIGDIKEIVSDLAKEDALEFVKLGEDFKNANTDLFDSLSDISGEIDGLKNTLSSEKTSMTNNLTSIANQFNLVMNLLIGEFESLKNGTDGISDIFVDVSDEDIENTKQGKIEDCHNSGTVDADRNTGGIAGTMAIEYSKDPEDDIEKPTTLNFTYRTKTILQGCINDGEVTGKKDCTGGIAGFSGIGTIYECQNYADIESKNGNYVGGVAGKSEAAIRRSYAKNKVTGKRYIGGIAGKAKIITACYAMVNVNGNENTGAVCGGAEDREKLYLNFYVDNGLGAVDGVSYKDKAEPIGFNELKNTSFVPRRFISFTVTFVADDKIIGAQEVEYGDDTSRIKFPAIPEKDGCFGKWQEPEAETITENIEITCEYQPYITVLSSVERNENGKLSLALAEGNFTDKAELHITEDKDIEPVKKADNIKVYKTSLINADIGTDETVKMRLLNENRDNLTVWSLENGEWERIDTKKNGKYATLELSGAENIICVQYTKRAFSPVFVVIFIAFVICALAICIMVKVRGRKRSTANKS